MLNLFKKGLKLNKINPKPSELLLNKLYTYKNYNYIG